MSDLLARIGRRAGEGRLIGRFGTARLRPSEEISRDFRWGSIAILSEPLAGGRNVVQGDDWILGWVGDLAGPHRPDKRGALAEIVRGLVRGLEAGSPDLDPARACRELDGAYAIVYGDASNLLVMTDIMNFTQVFCRMDGSGRIEALGTASDAVAEAGLAPAALDEISVGEFVAFGTPSYPHTMHRGLRELEPGHIHWWRFRGPAIERESVPYWAPPRKVAGEVTLEQAAERLRSAIVEAIRSRCDSGKTGVFLSGGLDSRLIMSCLPRGVDCIGITLADEANRETRTAERVARCYGNEWRAYYRGPEYLAETIERVVQLCGCDFEWVNAHAVGFSEAIAEEGCSAILSGLEFDAYLKGHFARDFVRVKRLGGLLEPRYVRRGYDYVEQMDRFWRAGLRPEVVEGIRERRRQHQRFVEAQLDGERISCEWLRLYPFSQNKIGAALSAERRLLPIRLVTADRNLVEYAMSCPVEWKLGGRVFELATRGLWGPGAEIGCANDGVKPGSDRLRRLLQRAPRKVADRWVGWKRMLTGRAGVQHSWSDYQKYWRESRSLARVIDRYKEELGALNDSVFAADVRGLLGDPRFSWEYGFRLVQLAVWVGIQRRKEP